MAGVTTYTEEVALLICERLSDGESLKAICEDEGMPSKSTVFKWLAENETFSDMYARDACSDGAGETCGRVWRE